MAAVPSDHLVALISGIRQDDAGAWEEFLNLFAPLLLQAARAIESDRDTAGDAFVFICNGLKNDRGKRLASYDPTRRGSFETWLRAVAANLARDARRARLGRFRTFRSIARLPPLEQRVFRLQYEQGFTSDQTLAILRPEFPELTEAILAAAEAELNRQVSSSDRLRLIDRRPQLVPVDEPDVAADTNPALASAAPDPEGVAMMRDGRRRLSEALATLSVEDRLIVQLHFERNVTLAQLAVSFGLPSPQAAHRRLREILGRLRGCLEPAVRSGDAVRRPDPGRHGDS